MTACRMSVCLQLFCDIVQESFQLGKEELVLKEEVLLPLLNSYSFFPFPLPSTLLPCNSVHLCTYFGSLIKEVSS